MPWHVLSPSECLARLEASDHGLNANQVAERRERWGRNALPQGAPPSWLTLLIRQFQNPMIYLLLVAAGISLWMGERTDALFIAVVLVLNAVVGAVQEGKAAASAEGLQQLVKRVARVERAGLVADIDAEELVPGDVVLLESGSGVPADLRLLSAMDAEVDESLLTGEAMPVAKDVHARVPEDAAIADRQTMVYAGSTFLSGRASGVVVATGKWTELGRINSAVRHAPAAPAPLILYLARLSKQIALGMALLVAALALILLLRGTAPAEILLMAAALAVSAIPEGLPVAVTVGLAVATRRMAARQVLVRNLPAVEGLGACTVIATDKTGTLTINQLSVEAILTPSGERLREESWSPVDTRLTMLAQAAVACNEANWASDDEAVGDSVDVALLHFGRKHGVDAAPERVAQFPYESVNCFASVLVRGEDEFVLIVKGAVETVAAMCDAPTGTLVRAADALAADGYRVLAVAHRRVSSPGEIDLARPLGLTPLGCVGLIDPLRPEAAPAVAACHAAGVRVCMITGDHPATALTIARQLGLAESSDQVLTGAQIAEVERQNALVPAIDRATVFARTDPLQKLRIVEAFRAMGHFVAVTGDGVNDGPALHAANIGIAMGKGGTDVARGAADLILVDDNFASIVARIEEGRVTFGNLRKITIFMLATGLAEIALFTVTIAIGLPAPLTAVQLLWGNIITETPQAVTLAMGRGSGAELDRPPSATDRQLINRSALILMAVPALAMALFATGLFGWELGRGKAIDEARSSVLLALVLFENAFVLAVSRKVGSTWLRSFARNRWLLVGVGGALFLHLVAMAYAPLREILGLTPLDAYSILACVAGAAITLIGTILAQRWIARQGGGQSGG
nr:HAD-IC family P-type ATPase [Sphingomonas sp. IC-56]